MSDQLTDHDLNQLLAEVAGFKVFNWIDKGPWWLSGKLEI